MATKIIWSDKARDDLDGIFLYLSDFSEDYAMQWSNKVFEDIESLEIFPEMGRIVPEKEVTFLREILVWKYRILYTFLNHDITIVRILHSSMSIRKI